MYYVFIRKDKTTPAGRKSLFIAIFQIKLCSAKSSESTQCFQEIVLLLLFSYSTTLHWRCIFAGNAIFFSCICFYRWIVETVVKCSLGWFSALLLFVLESWNSGVMYILIRTEFKKKKKSIFPDSKHCKNIHLKMQ